MIRLITLFAIVVLAAPILCWEYPVFAADGSLKANFKLVGTPPTLPKPKIDKDGEYCGPKVTADESIKVGPKGEFANVVMWMFVPMGKKAPESAAATAALAKEVKVDNLGCKFEPRITLLHTSQSLVIGNPDPIGHNTNGQLFTNGAFNELIPAGGSLKKPPFTKTEGRPMPLACNIHSWMGGWILIKDNPFNGVSDAKGDLSIKNIPEGKHTFVIWQEKAGYVTKGKLAGKDVEWKTGRIEIDVKGDVDLGEISVPVEVINKK